MTKILTTHVGSLPRTEQLLAANNRRTAGQISDEEFFTTLQEAVDQVVGRQLEMGLDIINEGEYGHITSGAVDYGAWWNYSFSRLGGLTMTDTDRWASQEVVRSTPGNLRLTSFPDRRDRQRFRAAYEDPDSGILTGRKSVGNPVITGPLTYIGTKDTETDIALLRGALSARSGDFPGGRGFMAALSAGSCARIKDEYYGEEKALLSACAQAMAAEYRLITGAGFTVQIDAPDLAEAWDQINPEPTVADFQDWLQLRIDAINESLVGIDPALVRLHICWGSWHGPHTTDIPFEAIVDQCLQVRAGSFSFEASSPRHAHEWRVWESRADSLGDRVLVPGVVCHSTNIVEHPQLVADRITQFARIVGPERVIASTDCGLGGRIHHQIAWAKLESLVEGAALASRNLGVFF